MSNVYPLDMTCMYCIYIYTLCNIHNIIVYGSVGTIIIRIKQYASQRALQYKILSEKYAASKEPLLSSLLLYIFFRLLRAIIHFAFVGLLFLFGHLTPIIIIDTDNLAKKYSANDYYTALKTTRAPLTSRLNSSRPLCPRPPLTVNPFFPLH